MGLRNELKCFKAYDVRAKIGEDFNENIAYRIGQATVNSLKAKSVVLGFDARGTSPSLARAVAQGICKSGADVLDIGLSGTEQVYAAVSAFSADAGVEVTASHNPIDYNGMKIVKKGSKPLSDIEFANIKKFAEENNFLQTESFGLLMDRKNEARNCYIDKILDFVSIKDLEPLKIVINSGNGAAGPTIDSLCYKLNELGIKTNFIYINHIPDGSFPNGIPNPMLEENRSVTADAVVLEEADFGVAFDGDFDRCFIFDHQGNFIPGEYLVGLLAEIFLRNEKGGTIVLDPRVIWNTMDVVTKFNGNTVVAKTGHAFVKSAMRNSDAIYGGEISAHHYFKDFFYCDSGMIPWLLIWQLLSKKKQPLSDLISYRKNLFPSSGELNFVVSDAFRCIQGVKDLFAAEAKSIDELDGISMSFDKWRFNLRQSNTEELVRLNIETKGDHHLLFQKIEEMKQSIKDMAR